MIQTRWQSVTVPGRRYGVMAGTLALLVLALAVVVCPANAQGLDPFTEFAAKGETTVLGLRKPVLTMGIVVAALAGLFGMQRIGASIGNIIVCAVLALGVVGFINWI